MINNRILIVTVTFFISAFILTNFADAQQNVVQQGNILYEGDALDQVNYERSLRGLRPYKRDHNLAIAAKGCCRYRCNNFIEGHANDFTFLPQECKFGPYSHLYQGPAGCARWSIVNHRKFNLFDKNGKRYQYSGWGSCCTYENWTYAGAYYCTGRDGNKYMHLFVR